MSYNPSKHGRAEYSAWVQLPNDFVVTEGDDTVGLRDQKFAQLVYTVNGGGGGGGGGAVDFAPVVTAISSQTAALIAGGLRELQIAEAYSRIIATSGTDTYIAVAPPGSSQSASVWRVCKIDGNGSRSWASSGAFNQSATDLPALTYAY